MPFAAETYDTTIFFINVVSKTVTQSKTMEEEGTQWNWQNPVTKKIKHVTFICDF